MTNQPPERTDGAARRQALEALDTLEQAAIGYCHLYERGDSARAARIAGMEMLAKSIRAALSALPAGQGSATALRDERPEPPRTEGLTREVLLQAYWAGRLSTEAYPIGCGREDFATVVPQAIDRIVAMLPAQAAPAHQGSATEQYVSNVEARELMDILRTLTPSGTALITSARELVRLYEQSKAAAPAPAASAPQRETTTQKPYCECGHPHSFHNAGSGACLMADARCGCEEYKAAPAPAGTPDTLTAAMDNTLAWKLGEVANKAVKEPAGDLIDRGLALRRLLEEAGFILRSAPRGGQR